MMSKEIAKIQFVNKREIFECLLFDAFEGLFVHDGDYSGVTLSEGRTVFCSGVDIQAFGVDVERVPDEESSCPLYHLVPVVLEDGSSVGCIEQALIRDDIRTDARFKQKWWRFDEADKALFKTLFFDSND